MTEIPAATQEMSPLPLRDRCILAGNTMRGRSLLEQSPAAAAIAACLHEQAKAMPPEWGLPRQVSPGVIVAPEPPTILSEGAYPWWVGAQGELHVAAQLAGLGPEWITLHSVPIGTRQSDIDHVVVGPAGVFTINTKHHPGAKVWVGEGRILVNGSKTDHLRNSRFEGERVTTLLTNEAVQQATVRALIAFVGVRHVQVKQRPKDVTVLVEHEVVGWLRAQPVIWSPAMTEYVARALCDSALWAERWTPVPQETLRRFALLVPPAAPLARAGAQQVPVSSSGGAASAPSRQSAREKRRAAERKKALIGLIRLVLVLGLAWWLLPIILRMLAQGG